MKVLNFLDICSECKIVRSLDEIALDNELCYKCLTTNYTAEQIFFNPDAPSGEME